MAIIGFFLPTEIAEQLAIPGAEAPEMLHMTLAFLGDNVDENKLNILIANLAYTANVCAPIQAQLNGLGRFTDQTDQHPFYASVDAPALPWFRQCIIDELNQLGVEYSVDHGFTPHVTLAYVGPNDSNPLETLDPINLTFDTLTLDLETGEEDDKPRRYDFPLKGRGTGQAAAPNYHESAGIIGCVDCYFSSPVDNYCERYQFEYQPGRVCDDWQPMVSYEDALHEVMEKAGRRNSSSDMYMIQKAHDMMKALGADCGGKSGSMRKTATPFQDLALADRDRTWDSATAIKAIKEWAGGDDIDWKKYRKAFMWYDGDDAEKQGAYKLPYCDIIDGQLKAIPRAIFAIAGGRGVNTTSIPDSEKATVRNHINRYYAKMREQFDDENIQSPFEKTVDLSGLKAYADEGNALKAVAQDDDWLYVENYIAMFNRRDLEGVMSSRKNSDGSVGEYFTKATTFDSDYTLMDKVVMDWEHRRQPDGVGPDDEEVLGYVDMKSAILDDGGLFVRRVLNRRNKFIKLLEPLIKKRLIGTSSEAIAKSVMVEKDGRITVWPLKRDTLTVNPMQLENIDQNTLVALKAAGVSIEETNYSIQIAKARAKQKQALVLASM